MITKQNSNQYNVYCLRRVSDNKVFYIGMTKRSIKYRKREHATQSENDFETEKGVYINTLWQKGDDFIVEGLSWFSSICEEAKHLETAYIITAIECGATLTNMSKIGFKIESGFYCFSPVVSP